jgi:hypothetical protein
MLVEPDPLDVKQQLSPNFLLWLHRHDEALKAIQRLEVDPNASALPVPVKDTEGTGERATDAAIIPSSSPEPS